MTWAWFMLTTKRFSHNRKWGKGRDRSYRKAKKQHNNPFIFPRLHTTFNPFNVLENGPSLVGDHQRFFPSQSAWCYGAALLTDSRHIVFESKAACRKKGLTTADLYLIVTYIFAHNAHKGRLRCKAAWKEHYRVIIKSGSQSKLPFPVELFII